MRFTVVSCASDLAKAFTTVTEATPAREAVRVLAAHPQHLRAGQHGQRAAQAVHHDKTGVITLDGLLDRMLGT